VVIVYVEEPGELTQQALAFARGLGEPLHAFAAGEAVPVGGVEALHVAEGDAFSTHAPAAIAQALVELVERLSPSAVVAAGTERGNEFPHAAARLTSPSQRTARPSPGEPLLVTRVRVEASRRPDSRARL
jgi:electron transfer flavoprotein alpha subunit